MTKTFLLLHALQCAASLVVALDMTLRKLFYWIRDAYSTKCRALEKSHLVCPRKDFTLAIRYLRLIHQVNLVGNEKANEVFVVPTCSLYPLLTRLKRRLVAAIVDQNKRRDALVQILRGRLLICFLASDIQKEHFNGCVQVELDVLDTEIAAHGHHVLFWECDTAAVDHLNERGLANGRLTDDGDFHS